MLNCKGVTPVSVYRNGRWQEVVRWQPRCRERATKLVLRISLWLMGMAPSAEDWIEVPDCKTSLGDAAGHAIMAGGDGPTMGQKGECMAYVIHVSKS